MPELQLDALVATDPLGYLAALGVLDVVARAHPAKRPSLRWTEGFDPVAVLGGVGDLDELIEILDVDRTDWANAVSLNGPDAFSPADDLKPPLDEVEKWFAAATDPADRRLLHALISEDAAAGNGQAKPTHLHFTAGQQKFLVMVRELREHVTAEDIKEALIGPWRFERTLPVLGWNSAGERIHALRGFAPSGDKKRGVPGADWLAFLGLRFLPVATSVRGQLRTARCSATWKVGAMDWPIWNEPLVERTICALMTLAPDPTAQRAAQRGLTRRLSASIRRSDQGGYGSFGPASEAALS